MPTIARGPTDMPGMMIFPPANAVFDKTFTPG